MSLGEKVPASFHIPQKESQKEDYGFLQLLPVCQVPS